MSESEEARKRRKYREGGIDLKCDKEIIKEEL